MPQFLGLQRIGHSLVAEQKPLHVYDPNTFPTLPKSSQMNNETIIRYTYNTSIVSFSHKLPGIAIPTGVETERPDDTAQQR